MLCSVKEEVIGGLDGGILQSFSDQVSEFLVVAFLEGFKGLGDLLGDLLSVDLDVLTDSLHVFLWVLSNFDDVVNIFPVLSAGVNGFAYWQRLLQLLHESDNCDETTDGFSHGFVLVCFFEELDSFKEDKGGLISFVNAEE